MRTRTRMRQRNSRSTSPQSLARASSLALGILFPLAGCASFNPYTLVPGQATLQDVEARMGRPAEIQPGPNGQTICWFPQLPWGHASYAARIGPDGRLIAVEQRLTEGNINQIVRGQSTAKEVHDLLGPSYMPTRYERMQRAIWTYPIRVPGHNLPKWFLVQMSYDAVVPKTYLMDDPQLLPPARDAD